MSAGVDWDLARAVARRVGGTGPVVPLERARAAVADLRACAHDARAPVAEVTGLAVPDGPAAAVVDRAGWVDANVVGFASVVDPVVERLRRPAGRQGEVVGRVGGAAMGAEVGAALGFLSSRVLGQYELFCAEGVAPRLLLVAPTIVAVEQDLEVEPHDFRLWVCLHEETHRAQFTAVPWLGPWLREQVTQFLGSWRPDPGDLVRRSKHLGAGVLGALRGLDTVGVLEQLMSPEERAALDRLTAVMSLLEGHADVVMDAVGPDVVPSVATIRQRFTRRRQQPSGTEALVRRLLGVETKLRQYRDGAEFVRAVVADVGMTGLNRVWAEPATLPTRTELADPGAWQRRVGVSAP